MLHCLCFSERCRFCSEMQGCVVLCFMARSSFKWRPLAATYLCRKAAKARFDNRPNPRGEVSKGEGSRPLPFGRFKDRGFSRGKGNRNPFPLEWRFWLLLSLLTKVTRRRQRKGKSRPGQKRPAPGRRTPHQKRRVCPPRADTPLCLCTHIIPYFPVRHNPGNVNIV